MILIISESRDVSTDKVLAWLDAKGFPFFRMNSSDAVNRIDFSEDKIQINHISVDSSTVVWDRRGYLKNGMIDGIPSEVVESLKTREWKVVRDYLFFIFEQKGIATFRHDVEHNKLIDLHIAQKNGLSVPRSFVVSSKKHATALLKDYKLITKPLKDSFKLTHKNYSYSNMGTEAFTHNDLDNLSENFYPILLQEQIDKIFEIRVFYWLGTCYSMAIFSQLDEKTKLDYRNYNFEKPNRSIPFELPHKIENKIENFMKDKKMKSGSIDIIYSSDKKFIFLEVNPSGQFDWLSANCNYLVEENIAKSLIEYGKR